MIALILAIFSCVLMMGITIDGLIFFVFPIISSPSIVPVIKHLLFWSSLGLSAWVGREVFYRVINFVCVDETQKGDLR